MNDIKLTRRLDIPLNGIPKEDRAFARKMEDAYLKGKASFKYKRKEYKVAQSYMVRMKDDAGVVYEVPLQEFINNYNGTMEDQTQEGISAVETPQESSAADQEEQTAEADGGSSSGNINPVSHNSSDNNNMET